MRLSSSLFFEKSIWMENMKILSRTILWWWLARIKQIMDKWWLLMLWMGMVNLLLTPTPNSRSKESKITRQSLIQYKPIRWSSGSWTVVLMTRATACNSGENSIFRADRGSRPWLTTIKFKQQILKVKIMKYRKGATILALFPRWKHFSWKLCHNLRILRKKSSLLTIL